MKAFAGPVHCNDAEPILVFLVQVLAAALQCPSFDDL